MKTVQPGLGPDHVSTATVKCSCCEATLEYNGLDIFRRVGPGWCIRCPVCRMTLVGVRFLHYPEHLRPRGWLGRIWDRILGRPSK